MRIAYFSSLTISLIMTGAIFGFFYAYVASGINGLSNLPADQAIISMNAINNAVRNGVFFPFFFLTPLACFVAAGLAFGMRFKKPALYLGLAGLVYLFGGMLLTMMVNVPLNEALKLVDVTGISASAAQQVWETYASDWSLWNFVRTVFSGISLLLVGFAIYISAKTK